ncbi:hypothetical protein MJ581_07270 [Escherichia coli]|nr:hypothetical protein MJ581_07270 [Escherichia coli]
MCQAKPVVCQELLTRLRGKLPIIGICLGHRRCRLIGMSVRRAKFFTVKPPALNTTVKAMFAGLTNPLPVARYHSLVGLCIPAGLTINAHFNGMVMAVRTMQIAFVVQFHPESFLLPGHRLLEQTLAGRSEKLRNRLTRCNRFWKNCIRRRQPAESHQLFQRWCMAS